MMRRLLAAMALVSALAAQTSNRDQSFRDDLHYLATELPSRHINLFHQVSRAQFAAAVDALDAAIPSLGDTAIVVRMAEIVALAGEAHTSLALPQGRTPFRWFPLAFFGFEDGWRVNAARADLAQLLGCRIVAIAGVPIEEVYTRVAPAISHENEAWLKQQFPQYAIYADILQTVGVISSLDSARWTFETLGGQQFSLDIATIPQGSISGVSLPDRQSGFVPLYATNSSQNYWYTYLGSTRTLYVAYNRCTDDPSRPFSQFAQEVFGVFDSQPVERLIIDLRNNPGGNSAVFDPFLAGLQARQGRFAGGVRKIAITGRRTASSAMLNALSLKAQPYTVLIGEPTGGKPNSYGDVLSFSLPNSGASVSYSTKYFSSPVVTDSVMPDRSVALYARDIFARYDPFLAAALADGGPAAEGSVALVNSATFRMGPVAAGSLATVFFALPGASGIGSSFPLPKKLGGVEVWLNEIPAPLVAVTAGQINLQVPFGLAPGSAAFRLVRDGAEVLSATVPVSAATPGLFLGDWSAVDQPGAILNQDYRPNTAAVRARRGEVIQIFGTGAGPLDMAMTDGVPPSGGVLARTVATPRVFVAGEPAEVVYSGMSPQFPGLWQINVRVPDAATVTKQAPVFVIAEGGAVSNGVTVWVEE